MNELTIRKAILDDKKHLNELAFHFHKYYEDLSGDREQFFFEGWEKTFDEENDASIADNEGVIYLAFDGDIPVGYVYAYFCPKCYYTVIDQLFVLHEYRGQKVGEKLMEKAEEFCKRYDCSMRVEVFEWNKKAINFYLKNNYKITTVVLEKN